MPLSELGCLWSWCPLENGLKRHSYIPKAKIAPCNWNPNNESWECKLPLRDNWEKRVWIYEVRQQYIWLDSSAPNHFISTSTVFIHFIHMEVTRQDNKQADHLKAQQHWRRIVHEEEICQMQLNCCFYHNIKAWKVKHSAHQPLCESTKLTWVLSSMDLRQSKENNPSNFFSKLADAMVEVSYMLIRISGASDRNFLFSWRVQDSRYMSPILVNAFSAKIS